MIAVSDTNVEKEDKGRKKEDFSRNRLTPV